MQRWREIESSLSFLNELLGDPGDGEDLVPLGPLGSDSMTVSVVEGWRGEIVHLAVTNTAGCFRHYKVWDPSFRNWYGLAMAMRDQPILDFPLCNKSFNLSYCGHDL
jgi:Ni,Fe-hydrogenase III large subunit